MCYSCVQFQSAYYMGYIFVPSWHKEWNWCARANLHFKKKSAGRERVVEHSLKTLASKEKAPTTVCAVHMNHLEHSCGQFNQL